MSSSATSAPIRGHFEERYGAGSVLEAPLNGVIEQMLGHRSVRAYSDKPLPAGTLEQLVAAAQSASTSSNLQFWSVIAVQDPGRRERLAALADKQKFIVEAPLFLVWLADLSRLSRLSQAQDLTIEALPYLEPFMVGLIDAALAAQNAVVAAESLGLGTVYVGAIRNHPEQVAAELGLPPMVMPVFGMCIGYPDPTRPASVKPRLPQAVVLHHEQYDAQSEAQEIAAYDEVLTEFQAGQGMATAGWSPVVLKRLQTIGSLRGRDRMREALKALGFELR
jgi:nitroreductase